ncbi:peptidase E [Candidatus Woesebacteria bacterium]|nr:peptidase E [Candidatus Woesebacteria bacterium]
MSKIVVIGGGEMGNFETLPFDKRIVELTQKKHPKALFIPTASGEPERYIRNFQKVYGSKLGCETDTLYLLKTKPTTEELRKKILSSDLIYVGGGNTLHMMKVWRSLGVDTILKEAYKKGIVLSGISAGGICWFDSGHSDSMSFSSPTDWKYINVKGLGIVKGIHCPHFNGGTTRNGRRILRRSDFKVFMKKYSSVGIAVDNNCAIEFDDTKFKVLSSKENRKAYKVYWEKGMYRQIEMKPSEEFLPLQILSEKGSGMA